MKKSLFLFICFHAWAASAMQNNSLEGKVVDTTGSGIPGASVYFTDLKKSAITDVNGHYHFENLPKGKFLVQVQMEGYASITEIIDLSVTTHKDFIMRESVVEIGEVVITGQASATEKNRTPTPIDIVTKIDLVKNSSTNIIDAIVHKPGISQLSTGSGISKPVIRGLGYNRVVVVNDGVRQEGQQWGDEHGIEVDEYSVNSIEILKGPASLSYGSDAMAGVVHFLTALTLPVGTVNGGLYTNYQTNNGLTGYSGNVAGNLNGIIWNVRYSSKMAHAYRNKYDGYVYNSGFSEQAASAILGLNRSWGYSHLHLGYYHMMPGLVEGVRDSVSGKFVRPFVLNGNVLVDSIVPENEMKKYRQEVPYQDIQHYKAVLNNSFILGSSRLGLTLGWQQNHRKEFGNPFNPGQYGLYFLLNTFNYDVKYIFPQKNNWDVSLGVNGMAQNSENKGTEFLVPAYDLFDLGAYVIAKKEYKKLDVSGGLRYDMRKENAQALYLDSSGKAAEGPGAGVTQKFKTFNSVFTGISGSIGFAYQFTEKIFSKLNIARGFRAPNIGELGANGEHEGTGRYEIGNPELKPEYSLQGDVSFGINAKHISFELDGFYNGISNFIYISKLSSVHGGDSIVDPSRPLPTFIFKQGNADLYGGEVMLDIHPHPLDWLHFENSFSFVNAVQRNATDSTRYLPFTPPGKIMSELRADFKKVSRKMKNTYVKVEMDNYLEQNKIYSAYHTETSTPGYTLINAGLGTDFVSTRHTGNSTVTRVLCSFYISVNNITDAAYQSHLSRLKYESLNYATGRAGVYNMGRNFSFKLVVPVDFKKPKALD